LTPWRARALSWVLEEWSAISRVFNRPPRLQVEELDLSRVLELASSAAGDESDQPVPAVRFQPPGRSVPNRARLAAVAVLAERESRLTTIQRLALVGRRVLVAVGAARRPTARPRAAGGGLHRRTWQPSAPTSR
jgi:hypothetical protein